MRCPESTKVRVEPTTLGITAIEIPHSCRFFFSCYEFIVMPICGVITSPHLFFLSQAQDDLQQWIGATDRLGPIFAATMLRRPEPNKKWVKPTILSIIAIEINHLTRFTFL